VGEARPGAQLKSARGSLLGTGAKAAITPGLPRLQMLPMRSNWLAARRASSIRACTSNHPAAPTSSSLLLPCQTSRPMCALAGNARKARRISAGNKARRRPRQSGWGRQHCKDLQPNPKPSSDYCSWAIAQITWNAASLPVLAEHPHPGRRTYLGTA